MTLAELIAALEAHDPVKVVPHGFTNPHSYRGYYDELAFEPATNVTVGAMLADARAALGSTYQGWKGGDYTMSGYTDCWIAQQGSTGETIGPLLLALMLAEPSAGACCCGEPESPNATHRTDGPCYMTATEPAADVPFVPPAADGLPAGTLEAASIGANRLDAWAWTPNGRNFLAHALVQLARAGWLRTEPGEPFEPVTGRTAPEPQPTEDQTVVAYRVPGRPLMLLCREHARDWEARLTPVTSEDLPDGGICTWHDCGRDVLA